jgi:Fe-S cluster assembly ATP-binding protein
MENNTLLKVENVWVQRPGADVLRGVNLTVQQGEVHTLLGLNGSGKSSLALTLMGSDGYTADYLAVGMRKPSRERIEEALAAVALSPIAYMSRMVDTTLSGGERKRIELAAVYAMQPRLAILDEPDSGVDVLCMEDILTLMRKMAAEGTAVLLITHRDEMADVADTASLMCGGAIVQTGIPREMRDYFAQRCRPHGDLLGYQPWGEKAGGTYQRIVTEEAPE